MAFVASDPRAALNTTASAGAPQTGLIADEQLGRFYLTPPQIASGAEKTWLLRGQNFVLAWSECSPGAELARADQPDEYVILLTDAASRARVAWEGEEVEVSGPQIVFVPGGASRVVLPDGGRVTRLFTVKSADLVSRCPNAGAYEKARPHIPPFAAWPDPVGGWKIRAYALDVAPEPGRFGRIFRCTTFMLNVFEPMAGPRDPAKMSPHSHDDFEQCSLVVGGHFVHHLRWPWTTDLADWRDDLHLDVGAPSALVIPPPVIHTSQATGIGDNDLVDIFCPPRHDFSLKDGWVINAADYPMPGNGA